MSRIRIEDLPPEEQLSPEELQRLYGAGPNRFRPGVEALEGREMYAANITASLLGSGPLYLGTPPNLGQVTIIQPVNTPTSVNSGTGWTALALPAGKYSGPGPDHQIWTATVTSTTVTVTRSKTTNGANPVTLNATPSEDGVVAVDAASGLAAEWHGNQWQPLTTVKANDNSLWIKGLPALSVVTLLPPQFEINLGGGGSAPTPNAPTPLYRCADGVVAPVMNASVQTLLKGPDGNPWVIDAAGNLGVGVSFISHTFGGNRITTVEQKVSAAVLERIGLPASSPVPNKYATSQGDCWVWTFTQGGICWFPSASGGAHAFTTETWTKWMKLGGPASKILGLPTTEMALDDTAPPALGPGIGSNALPYRLSGWVNSFQKGAISYSHTAGSAAYMIHDQIYQTWNKSSYMKDIKTGTLGLPIADQDDSGLYTGFKEIGHFQHGDLWLAQPPHGHAQAAPYEIYGTNFVKWSQLGGADGWLGKPTAGETNGHFQQYTNGHVSWDRQTTFEKGIIYWNCTDGKAWAIDKRILEARYLKNGTRGPEWLPVCWDVNLGRPAGDSVPQAGSLIRSEFEHGAIIVDQAGKFVDKLIYQV